KMDQAEALMADIDRFRSEHGVERVVMVWCGSTESYRDPSEVHMDLASFEKGLKESHPDIAPSQIYAYAALQSDVPFANGAPNLAVVSRGMGGLGEERGVPISGKDF